MKRAARYTVSVRARPDGGRVSFRKCAGVDRGRPRKEKLTGFAFRYAGCRFSRPRCAAGVARHHRNRRYTYSLEVAPPTAGGFAGCQGVVV